MIRRFFSRCAAKWLSRLSHERRAMKKQELHKCLRAHLISTGKLKA